VPIVGWAADAAKRRQQSGKYLFPVTRPRCIGDKPKNEHMSADVLNHAIRAMPGVNSSLSPHAVRRAFGTYGRKYLGFAYGEARIILDHMERMGEEERETKLGGDVTHDSYDLDPLLKRKREMMLAWVAWLDDKAAEAVAADPMLRDRDALRTAVYIARYGEDLWEKRVLKARKEGRPVWPADDAVDEAA